MNELIVVDWYRDDRSGNFRRDVHDFGQNPAVPGPWRDHVGVPHGHDQYGGNAGHDERDGDRTTYPRSRMSDASPVAGRER